MDHRAVRERLVRAARSPELFHYGDIAPMLGIDMDNPHFGALVGSVLGEMNTDGGAYRFGMTGRGWYDDSIDDKDPVPAARGPQVATCTTRTSPRRWAAR
jgi:hypothetical protein